MRFVKEHGTLHTGISSTSLNKIFVVNDRINEIYGIEGAFKLEKDETEGSVYVMPTGFYKNTPFDLFVKTEQGRHYTLHLTPSEQVSATIALKPLSPAKNTANRWETSTTYENTLLNLIKNMIMHDEPDGYAVIPLGKDQLVHHHAPLVTQLKTIYRGDHLEGQVWSVINKSKQVASLAAKELYKHGVLAAAFEQTSLMPNQTTTLYLVIRHDS